MASNYTKSLYKDYEELSEKLDKITNQLTQMEKEHRIEKEALLDEIKSLREAIAKKDELINKLIEEKDKYRNQSNKNSSNSGKPSSTDINKPKKTGANLYNSRVKTSKKVGAQIGHKGNHLSKEKIEKDIEEGKVKVIDVIHTIKGNHNNTPVIKYKVGMRYETIIERHVFNYDEEATDVMPKEFYTDVTYTNEFKSLVVFMNVHNVLSMKRLTEFFKILSNGIINMSEGSIVNMMAEFSKKSISTINNIVEDILKDKTNYTDETVSKIDGKSGFVRNYSNESSVVYKSHYNKGHAPIKEDDILTKFTGVIMGDHDTTLDSYGSKRIECNVHLGRYTVEITQNTFDASWAEKMKVLLETGNKTREYAKAYGLDGFTDDNYEWYSKKFDEIIKEAQEETKKMKSSFYKKKSKTLYTRLKRNKERHLAYLKDFSLPYSNNLSESDLRVYKIKLKVSGGFRSKKGSDYFANALSVVKTSKKRKENILENIKKIFCGETLFTC